MRVALFLRKSYPSQYSIERVHYTILPFLKEKVDIQLHVMPFRSKGVLRRLLNGVYAWLKKKEVNHISGDINYIAAFLPSKKTVLTIHDIYPVYSHKKWKKHLFELLWLKVPISRVQKIIFISAFTEKEVLSRYALPSSKYCVIPNAVSPDFLTNNINHHIEKELPHILHIGMKENKNLQRVIEALSGIECKLILIGKPDTLQEEKLKHYKIKYEYHESVSNQALNELYALSDLVLFVSTYEGFGLPIIEAQAEGRPIITSNIASMPEVAGEGAVLVDPYSVEEIRAAVVKVLDNRSFCEELIKKGKENLKRFEPKEIAKKYIELYDQLARQA